MRAVIVGNAQSAAGFNPPDDVTVIAVNGAIDWLSRADYWFTLDPSPENVQRMWEQKPGTKYVAAVPDDFMPLPPGVWRMTRIAERGEEPSERNSADWWLWRWSAVKTLCEEYGFVHTGNSTWGALGLAYHLGAERVCLVGVDADSKPTIDGHQCNNLSHLPVLFESALHQVDLVNCGHMHSAVPKMSIQDGLQWLTS